MRVGENEPPVVSVPVMVPVLLLIDSPGGRPLADQTRVPEWLSVALLARETISPALLLWSAGVAMLRGLATFQVKVAWALVLPSPTTSVTVYGPLAAAPAAMVPEIRPVPALMDRPAGSPKAP